MSSPLRALLQAVIVVPELDMARRAWTEGLGYRVLDSGPIGADLAAAWNAPAMAGRPFVLLGPESGIDCTVRLVAGHPDDRHPKPLTTVGWNAVELLVDDVDALAAQIEERGFSIFAPPLSLPGTGDAVRAMQVLGAAGEMLFLTTIRDEGLGLGSATCAVDRMFIVTLGTRSAATAMGGFERLLDAALPKPTAARMPALNRSYGLDRETRHLCGVIRLAGPFMIEIDEFPEGAEPRHVVDGCLPPGVALISVTVDDLEPFRPKANAASSVLQAVPYHGRSSLLLAGPEGVRLELVGRGT